MVALGAPVMFVLVPAERSSGTVTSTSKEHDPLAAIEPPVRRIPCLSVSMNDRETLPPPHSVDGNDGETTEIGNDRNPLREAS